MNAPDILLWLAVGFLVLKATQYVLGARIYLTSAVREPDIAPVRPDEISPGERDLLTCVDTEMQSAGFRHVGFGQCPAFLTYHGPPEVLNVFVHDQMSANAIVRRHPVPARPPRWDQYPDRVSVWRGPGQRQHAF